MYFIQFFVFHIAFTISSKNHGSQVHAWYKSFPWGYQKIKKIQGSFGLNTNLFLLSFIINCTIYAWCIKLQMHQVKKFPTRVETANVNCPSMLSYNDKTQTRFLVNIFFNASEGTFPFSVEIVKYMYYRHIMQGKNVLDIWSYLS